MEESFSFKTKDDLLEFYDGKSHLVDDLMARKHRNGQWRYHPEFPGREETMQFWATKCHKWLGDRLAILPVKARRNSINNLVTKLTHPQRVEYANIDNACVVDPPGAWEL